MGAAERGGNHEQVRTARKYFAHSLELKPSGNLRALYGLLLCCAALGNAKSRGGKERDTAEVMAFASKALAAEYEEKANPVMLALCSRMIDGLKEQ